MVDLCQAMSVAKRVSEEYGCRLGSELNRGTSQTSQVRRSTTLNARHLKRLTLGDGFHKRHSGHRIASVTRMNCDVGSTQGVCGELQTVHNGHGPCIYRQEVLHTDRLLKFCHLRSRGWLCHPI